MLANPFQPKLLLRILGIAIAAWLMIIPVVPSQALEPKLTLAIIPGEGPREASPEIIAQLEVALSQKPGLTLVERSQIQTVLREITLSAGGFLNPSQSPRLGEILGAQVLIFLEKMPTPDGFIDRYRLVDGKTGIVMDTLFEDEQAGEKAMTSVTRIIDQTRRKFLVPLNQRHYIGILELRNTEPGTSLDGIAEALKMFLANDLSLAPNVFVLDREHLQRLQDEETLSNADLNLKASAYLIEGGIQHSPDRSILQVQLLLHKMDGTGTRQIDVQVPADDIPATRRILQQRILEPLNAKTPIEMPGSERMEGAMFLKRVAPLLFAGQYEDAVRAAEVAYALQPDRDSTFWASRAWYFLGKDLMSKIPTGMNRRRYSRRTRLKGPVDDIGESFAPPQPITRTRTDLAPVPSYVATASDTQAPQTEVVRKTTIFPSGERTRTITGTSSEVYQPDGSITITEDLGPGMSPKTTIIPPGERIYKRNRQPPAGNDFWGNIQKIFTWGKKPRGVGPAGSFEHPDRHPISEEEWNSKFGNPQRTMAVAGIQALPEQKKRVLETLLRAVQLGQEFTDRYVRDFSSGQVSEIPMPDPFANPQEAELARSATLQNEDSLWAMRFPLREDEPDLRETQNTLIAAETSLLVAQRAFYLGLSDKDARAVEGYWQTWQREGQIVLNHYLNDPRFSLSFYQRIAEAFQKNTTAFPPQRAEGFWKAINLPPAMTLTPETTVFFKNLSQNSDPFLRMAADRLLMRVDPATSAGEMLKASLALQEQVEAKGTRLEGTEKFFADFLTPAVNHLAVYDRDALLSLAPSIIEPVLKANNADQLTAWRFVLWPYLNALSQDEDKQPALTLIERCQDILKAVPIEDASLSMNRLRAELDLKLVWLGAKSDADPMLQKFFYDPTTPSYLRQRAEIEPPRPDGPLDLNGFGQLPVVHGQKYHSTISRSNSYVTSTGGGVSSDQKFERDVDAEGNEVFTSHSIQAQPPQADNRLLWAGYEVKKTDLQVAGAASMFMASYEQRLITRNMLIDDDSLYEIVASPEAKSVKFTAYRYSLTPPRTKHLLGITSVPVPGPDKTVFVTSLVAGDDKLFAGTTAGVLIYSASASLPMNDEPRAAAPSGPIYIPYSVEMARAAGTAKDPAAVTPSVTAETGPTQGTSTPPPLKNDQTDKTVRLDENSGLPDDRVLSLTYLDGVLYIAIGPDEEFAKSLHGVSGLVSYDPASTTYKVLVSSRALNGRGPLEMGKPYQIKALLPDRSRQCLWLAVGGNQELNGIWRYDIATGDITQTVREELSVLDLQWSKRRIIYAMYQSGWSMFDPDTNTKTWLMGYTVSAWTGVNAPLAPKDTVGQPLYGFPKTRLWPFAADSNENIITVGWDAYELLLQGKQGPAEPLKKLDPQANYVSEIAYVAKNQQGLWVVMRYGQVYLLTPLVDRRYAPAPAPTLPRTDSW